LRKDKDWRSIWPDEDLGLMLYDVFDHNQRAHGFRWLSEDELQHVESAREMELAALPKAKRKAAAKEPLIRHEGVCIKPQAAFFHACVKDARIECNPEKVKIIMKTAGEG
jgi:CRISPR-associated protein Cas5d